MREVQRSYGNVASLYTRLFGSTDSVHRDDLALLARSFDAGPILDLGCGPGHLTAYLCDLGLDARGLDLVPEFIEHARTVRPDVGYDVGSMVDLDCDAASVGGILAWYSLIHTPPDALAETLAEFRRVLRPDGTLVVGFFTGGVVEPFDHKVITAYRWPIDELVQRLSQAGFTEIERAHRPADDNHRSHGALVAR